MVRVPAGAPRLASLEIDKVPPRIDQLVSAGVVLVKVHVLVPVFWKTPKFWYCAFVVPAAAICETSKLALPAPPKARTSAAEKATALPMMVDPGCSVRLLSPPVKVIALARRVPGSTVNTPSLMTSVEPDNPPRMEPELTTARLAPVMPTPPGALTGATTPKL